MTIADAIKECERRMQEQPETVWWIRAVRWRGYSEAVRIMDNDLWGVPQGVRPRRYIPRIDELVGDWEVVTSDDVLGEREWLNHEGQTDARLFTQLHGEPFGYLYFWCSLFRQSLYTQSVMDGRMPRAGFSNRTKRGQNDRQARRR